MQLASFTFNLESFRCNILTFLFFVFILYFYLPMLLFFLLRKEKLKTKQKNPKICKDFFFLIGKKYSNKSLLNTALSGSMSARSSFSLGWKYSIDRIRKMRFQHKNVALRMKKDRKNCLDARISLEVLCLANRKMI